jgi:hypothetical protein
MASSVFIIGHFPTGYGNSVMKNPSSGQDRRKENIFINCSLNISFSLYPPTYSSIHRDPHTP